MKRTPERMAPSLPVAALMPWAKPRTREGKTSPGTMKLVALGPKLKKSCWKGGESVGCLWVEGEEGVEMEGLVRGEGGDYLSDSETDEFPRRPQPSIIARNDPKHERADQEALDLNPASTEDLDEVNCQIIARYVTGGRDDEISICVFEKGIVFRLAL